MSVHKCVSASGYGVSCQAGKLDAEISRLTAELAALESQHRWRSVAEGLPPKNTLVLIYETNGDYALDDTSRSC